MNDTNKPEVKASEIDIRGTFLKLGNRGIWGAGAEGRMRLNVPTADALALAMSPVGSENLVILRNR